MHLAMHSSIKTAIISVTLECLLCHLTLSTLCIHPCDCTYILTLLKFHVSKTLKCILHSYWRFLLFFYIKSNKPLNFIFCYCCSSRVSLKEEHICRNGYVLQRALLESSFLRYGFCGVIIVLLWLLLNFRVCFIE